MQDWPLLVSKIIEHAALNHGSRPILTNTVEGGLHRSDWATVHRRAKRLAQALLRLGINAEDRVATLAWNTHRHVEAWYGISGMGAVAHTLNPRLFTDQLVYIINHAQDRALLFDLSFLKLVEALAPRLHTVEHFIVLTDAEHRPETSLHLLAYESLLEAENGDYAWPELDERAPAGLCYTSGTTGLPKGVLYSHRSNVLHTFAGLTNDTLGVTPRDVMLPVVPMFHANAWGIPYSTAAVGGGLVLNGPAFDAPTLQRLILDHGVTLTAAVPTVWLAMLAHLDATGSDLGPLKRVMIGGAAAPPAMIEAFEERYGVEVLHAWGMTEMSPLGTVGTLTAEAAALPASERFQLKTKQGRAPFGVEMRIEDESGRELPRDGRAFGHLKVRGPWIVEQYFGEEQPAVDADGWFDTGDVATLDPHGFMQIVDRSKDVIKSGGEWISSIELENLAVGCPGVAEAAVIGLPHPKWDERPLLIIVPKVGAAPTKPEILAFLEGKIARWWMPDDIVFVDKIPHTAAGKIQKTALREQFRDYRLPTAA